VNRVTRPNDVRLDLLGSAKACPAAARGAEAAVRAFVPSLRGGEDPVTGSLNAGLAA
jgi:predicted PhzF superfamily epimerase YddE/YHI9